MHNLILQVLKSIFANKFFDLDFSLKTVIPVLMNLTLNSKFHPQSSLQSKLSLKEANAELLGTLMERFHQKYQLKVEYAEFLLKQLLDKDVHPLCVYGCLACLSRFGHHITKRVLLPKVSEIAQR